jgi:hypothetical protein
MRFTMKAFLPASDRALLLEPEADEQVRAEADALPPHEHQGQVAAQDEEQHEEREEVQVREVADAVLVVGHVAERVDVDEPAHAGHDQDHHARQRVHQQAQGHAEPAGLHPLEAEVGLREAQPVPAPDQGQEANHAPDREAERRRAR